MVRVGIEFSFADDLWIGGVNGIGNLLHALKSLPQPRIEVILIASQRTPESLFSQLPATPVLRTRLVDHADRTYLVRRANKWLLGNDILMDRWLRANGVEVFSHCDSLGRRARTPTIGQIADFGYIAWKKLYPEAAFQRMHAGTGRVLNQYDTVMMPSFTVAEDYRRFFPEATAKAAPLPIIPSEPVGQRSEEEFGQVRERYKLPEHFLYVPNQFWVHKNHGAIVEAMAILSREGRCPHVVSTGKTHDPRRPNHFDELMQHADAVGVADRLHVLGLIPYPDTVTLMQHCVAVMSASRFEGWGLTVAEARMLGKTIILSDIPVFREQAPEHGHFFDPDDTVTLARHMATVAETYSPVVEGERRRRAQLKLPRLIADYARGYEDIVLDTLARKRGRAA
jgi:glycosyltransferase involved in cell wall biosynthesis